MLNLSFEHRLRLGNAITQGLTVAITGVVTLLILTTIVKFVWGWVIPDLFPASVDQGLIVADMSWLTAFKLIVLSGLLTAGGRLIAVRTLWAGDPIPQLSLRQMPGADSAE